MRLIFIVASVISGFVAITLVFFQATRKTYPGFGLWTAGVGFLTVGYLALALRGFIPDALSIFVSNGAFPLGMVFLLDGLRRFLGLAPMSRVWYALPGMDLVAIAILYYLYDLAFWRTVVTATAISAPHWPMAALIFRHPARHESIFYSVIGCLLGLAGLVVLARPLGAFFLPQWHLFIDSPFQLGSLMALIVLQLGESLSLMMLNSERVESELTESEADLSVTVDRLQQALAEQKKAEEALRYSEQKLSLALEGANVGIWEWNLTTGKAIWSERIHKILGLEPNEFEPTLKNWKKIVHPDDWPTVAENLNLHIHGEIPTYEAEYRALNKSGDWHWVHIQGKVIEVDADGKPIRMTGVVADATERKKAEEERERLRNQLLQAQKMEAIGTLTGGIAHDFNNLLTIVNGFTEMILLQTREDDPRYKDLKKILQTGQKGADMVQRLLAFSKKAPVSPQPLDLNDIVENSIKLMEGTFPKMIEIQALLSSDLGLINADPGQIEQLLMNLSVNARDAMPDGGLLMIGTKNITVDEEYCRLHAGAKPGRHVLIEVSDTGTGMSQETVDRIFDPFFTTKGWDFRKGTGLGLSVAKGIVEQHGGWIACRSELAKGTTFTVYFPAIKDSPAVRETRSAAATASGAEKILLIDDEEYVRDLGKRILERAGYTVITAANGKEALEIYAREQSNIALVVLDLIMPQMDGAKCLEELLKINPQVKVIVSTGHSMDAQERLHLGSMARGFVNKPYEVRQLVQAVRGILSAGGPTYD
jgi:PAS domain S-box-containing protein